MFTRRGLARVEPGPGVGMMGDHERGSDSGRRTTADPTTTFRDDRPVEPVVRAVPLAAAPSRPGPAVARAQELATQSHAAGATARDVLDGTGAALRELGATRATLDDAVGALATRLRRDGAPPERMLVLVKDAARAATPPGADPPAARDLMARAVRLGIAAYFAA